MVNDKNLFFLQMTHHRHINDCNAELLRQIHTLYSLKPIYSMHQVEKFGLSDYIHVNCSLANAPSVAQ